VHRTTGGEKGAGCPVECAAGVFSRFSAIFRLFALAIKSRYYTGIPAESLSDRNIRPGFHV